MADLPDRRGYVHWYRKAWDCVALKERGHVFSKMEAWLYIVSVMARGVATEDVGRGEFIASYRYLSRAWNWETTKTFRFIKDLEKEGMLKRNPLSMQHQPQHLAQHFIVCNYETYNPTCNTERNTNRNKVNKDKESINKKAFTACGEQLSIPTKNGTEFVIPEALAEEYRKAYPTVDLVAAFRHMRVWCLSNPVNLKTERGMPKFMNAWLKREAAKNGNQEAFKNLFAVGCLK